MSDAMLFKYALQEPALAIAPVFLSLQKGNRKKLDVIRTFGESTLHWRGPDALGIHEQSVLLGLLSIAGQQTFTLDPHNLRAVGRELLARLSRGGPEINSDLAVVKARWAEIVAASGYKSTGGNNVKIVQRAVQRLAETTVWEKRLGAVYESRLLALKIGNDDGVTLVLNRRATDAVNGGQFIKISLEERNSLPDEPAKALHAWLSGHMRPGSTSLYKISNLQFHVWGGDATGSTLRSRRSKLRNALVGISSLPNWNCRILSDGDVEIKRINQGTIDDGSTDYPCAPRTIDNGRKAAKLNGKTPQNCIADALKP